MNTITSPNGKKFAITKDVLTALTNTMSTFEYLFKNSGTVLPAGHGIMLSGGGEDPETGAFRTGLIFLGNELFLLKAGDGSVTNYAIVETNTNVTGVDINGNQYETLIKLRVAQASATGTYLFANLHPMPIMLQRKRFELQAPIFSATAIHPDATLLANSAFTYTDSRTGMFYCGGKLVMNENAITDGRYDVSLFTLPIINSLPSHPSAIDRFYFTIYIKRVNRIPVTTHSRVAYVNISDRKVYLHGTTDDRFDLQEYDEIYFDFSYYTNKVSV